MLWNMSTEKRVALVTGGAKRVGRAIVEALAEAGFAVAFTYHRSEREAEELWMKYKAHAIGVDLTHGERAIEAIRDSFAKFSNRLDVLVNSASDYHAGKLDETTPELMRRMMAIHFEAPLLLTQAFEPELRANRGHVINMCDLLAERPWPDFLAYCA